MTDEMTQLAALFEQRLTKIAMLEDFVTVFGRRTELITQRKEADMTTAENRELLAECRQRCRHFRTELLPRVRNVIGPRMERLQAGMLNMLEELQNRDEAQPKAGGQQQQQQQQQRMPLGAAAKSNGSNTLQVPSSVGASKENRQPLEKTPDGPNSTATRLLLSDYKNSPFARRMRPAALQFIDFEATIRNEEFARLPQYMRGRETLADLRHFLDAVIVRCFTDKYTLLNKVRDCVRNPQQLTLWKHYRQQAEYFPHRMFITQGDIATLTGRMVDKKTANRIAMLRHLQLVQEQRHQSTVCYLWLGMQ